YVSFIQIHHYGYFNGPEALSGPKKIDRLREIESADLVAAMGHLKNHTFRPVTDDLFIFQGFTEFHRSGAFAEQFKRRDLRMLIGEVLNEETLYATYNSPASNLDSLRLQVSNYYAPEITERVFADPDGWKTRYGNIIADGQVRAPSRCLIHWLHSQGVPHADIWRYRIAYRLSFITDKVAPWSFGVSHAMDTPFWNFSILNGPTEAERTLMENWIQVLKAFVQDNRRYDFDTWAIGEMKVATPEGTIEIQRDERWPSLVQLGEVFANDL
ncbi:alpha/beta-hydrolase, partial [Penicillium macrosclerotiorum]|uniref:alpha/beta-hydrolase n=1 Tax=Penicillium macrosclerotiorum TaxID=303699 RepID=UPI002547117C